MTDEEKLRPIVENLPKIAVGVALLVAILLAVGFFLSRQKKTDVASFNQFYSYRQEALALAEEEKFADAIAKVEQFRSEHPNTDADFFALMLLANFAKQKQDHQKAVQYAQEAERHAPSELLRSLSLYNQGKFLEEADDSQPAIHAYQAALELPSARFLAPDILYAQALLFHKEDKLEEARTVLQQLKTDFSKSTFYVRQADALLSKVAAQLNTEKTTP